MTLSVLPHPDQVPQPPVFGLDAWPEWRPHQWEAVNQICDMEEGILGLNCPTGFGKSLTYIAAAVMSNRRTVVLTGTKALQDQLDEDFSQHITLLKGRNAYDCLSGGKSADDGPCRHGVKCEHRSACSYQQALSAAKVAPILVTNYAAYLSHVKYSEGLGDIDVLVCDEAHSVETWLDWITQEEIHLGHPDLATLDRPDDPDEWQLWSQWAETQTAHVTKVLAHRESELRPFANRELSDNEKTEAIRIGREKNRAARLLSALEMLSYFHPDRHVLSRRDKSLVIQRVQISGAFQTYLSEPPSLLVLTSATISPKTLDVFGIEPSRYTWAEYPTPFDLPARNPFVHIPTVRMNHRTDGNGKALWLSRIDQILRLHPKDRGIIHTVSYARAQFIMEHSRQRPRLLTHTAKSTVAQVHAFKASRKPQVLLSPSLGTGHDFPGDTCRFQIISKIPYPDTRDRLLKRRSELDPDYISYLTMIQLVQICGRGMRSTDDYCTNYVIDDNVSWFLKRFAPFAPQWFLSTFRRQRTL